MSLLMVKPKKYEFRKTQDNNGTVTVSIPKEFCNTLGIVAAQDSIKMWIDEETGLLCAIRAE